MSQRMWIHISRCGSTFGNVDPHLEMWIHIRGTSHLAVRTLLPRRPCGGASRGSRNLPGPGEKLKKKHVMQSPAERPSLVSRSAVRPLRYSRCPLCPIVFRHHSLEERIPDTRARWSGFYKKQKLSKASALCGFCVCFARSPETTPLGLPQIIVCGPPRPASEQTESQ